PRRRATSAAALRRASRSHPNEPPAPGALGSPAPARKAPPFHRHAHWPWPTSPHSGAARRDPHTTGPVDHREATAAGSGTPSGFGSAVHIEPAHSPRQETAPAPLRRSWDNT